MRSRSVVQKNLADVLRFLWSHWRTQSRSVVFVTVALTFGMLADLLLPVFSGRLIDAISATNAPRAVLLHTAILMLGAMALLGLLLVIARYGAFIGVSRLTVEVMSRMGSDAFWRVQRLSTDWQANNFAGSIIRRITRGMWAADLMNDTLLLALFPASLILTGSSLVLALRWPSMGLLVALASLSYVVASIALALRWVAPAAHLSNAQDTRIGGALADAVTCNSVVKSFGAEEREEARLQLIFAKWRARTYRHWVYGSRSGTAQLLLLIGMRTLVTSYAVYLWWRGQATPGDVTFVLTSYFIIHGYLRDVGQHVANLQRSMNEMEALVTLHREPLAVADAPAAANIRVSNGDIAFDHVTFRYEGQSEPLFRNFSLHIKAGERVGLVGHSGSGKTTFVKLLQRLYDVSDGRILIDGQDIAEVTQKSLRSALALVAQEPILFHRSLAENIAYGRPEASRSDIEEAACLANAHDFIRALPKDYRTLVGERGVKLSGGERQRVALARAFLANAPILILDEATSSLDSVSEAAIQDAMERLLVGRTSIVIAHRLATVRMLDRILVFDNGRIVEEGTHDELVRRSGGTYQRLFEKQALGLVATTAAS